MRGRSSKSSTPAHRKFLFLALLFGARLAIAAPDSTVPLLSSIRMVTISSEDPGRSASAYEQFMGYDIVEDLKIDASLAKAWGAPAAAGRRYLLLRSPDPESVFLRFVETRIPQSFQSMRSGGWSAVELLTKNPYELQDGLASSPFVQLAPPAALTKGSSIHAMQYLGADGEVVYLTADLDDSFGPRASSTLARTGHPVGRPFIVVAAGSDLNKLSAFYGERFSLAEAFRLELPIPFLARAQSLTPEHKFPLTLLRLGAFSHSIELDEYPEAPSRPTLPGELTPGIAVVTFCKERSSKVDPLLGGSDPHDSSSSPGGEERFVGLRKAGDDNKILTPPGIAYQGAPVEILNGEAGELIEVMACEPP